jgi:predicted nucleic acid-binding protein
MPTETRVLVDANILFSRTLRDWVLMLSLEAEVFQVFTSESIVAETLYRFRRKHPRTDEKYVALIRKRVTETIGQERVLRSFPIPGPHPSPCPDPHDAHVHAAALAADAEILLTADKGVLTIDPGVADNLPYEVFGPDDFLVLIDACHPTLVRAVLSRQVAYALERRTEFSLPQLLGAAGCPNFAQRVRAHLQTTPLATP